MKALRVQFTVDLGDHMYVCNQSDAEHPPRMPDGFDEKGQRR